ncbi:MAG: hypothetical protein LRY30_00055, partial [Gammaproteobacteria bacterium]|nr:hypothetical protein [Gammaproteobacteria bacterium]
MLDHASKYHLQQILENVGFRDTFEECTVFTQRIPETRIFRTAEALKAKAKSRDERLLSYAGGQDKINEFIDDFGFERNIPNYSALPNENKRQWEKLALLAVAPAIGTPAARISALSESAVPVDVLSKTVARSIGQVYGVVFEQGDYEKFNMPLFLNQILEKCGFWGTWSSQYKTIKKIITLTQENPPLSGAKIARALRYIDQLSPSFFDSRAQESLRTLFLNLREETGMAIINKSLRSNSKGEEEHTEIA